MEIAELIVVNARIKLTIVKKGKVCTEMIFSITKKNYKQKRNYFSLCEKKIRP